MTKISDDAFSVEWARKWPGEEIWVAEKRR